MIKEFLKQFSLSEAEKRVAAEILSTGLPTNEIAEDMELSNSTIKNHCHSIYKKTESLGRSDFQALYIQFLENELEVAEKCK